MNNTKCLQVTKAVGFMNQRLDVPKDVDPQWASLIERCLCRFDVHVLIASYFTCSTHDPELCFDYLCIVYDT